MNGIAHLNECLQYLSLILLSVFLVSCDNNPDNELRFAVIGDLHYSIQDSLRTDSLVQSVAGELNRLPAKPEFIIQTGDFFHGDRGADISSEAKMAFKHFARYIGMPYFVAKGNNDSRNPYEKSALPLFSRELGHDVLK